MAKNFGKDAWIELLSAAGLDEKARHQWHAIFEARWPNDHQRFLEWLGIPGDDASKIRTDSRNG